jgi:hypothetical protein
MVAPAKWRRARASLLAGIAVLGGAAGGLLGSCGPFTDVAADAFCPFVLEIFYLGTTTGTTPTTYDPTATVTRLQMAAFLSRTVDGALKRGSRRATLDQFWTSKTSSSVGLTTIGGNPIGVRSDGADIWAADGAGGVVSRIRASDGRLLETWTGAVAARGVLCGFGRVLLTGLTTPNGSLYLIDPTLPPGAVVAVATNLGDSSRSVAFDGAKLWTANNNSLSIVTPAGAPPWTVTTVTAGFGEMYGPEFDGTNMWAANLTNGTLLKLSAAGAILSTVTAGAGASFPLFDGSNIWVPNMIDNTITVVRASSGAVLATLTGNGLNQPRFAAFDGQRVLVTSLNSNNVSLWKAADLAAIGAFDVGAFSNRAASDGYNFWVTFSAGGLVAKF